MLHILFIDANYKIALIDSTKNIGFGFGTFGQIKDQFILLKHICISLSSWFNSCSIKLMTQIETVIFYRLALLAKNISKSLADLHIFVWLPSIY